MKLHLLFTLLATAATGLSGTSENASADHGHKRKEISTDVNQSGQLGDTETDGSRVAKKARLDAAAQPQTSPAYTAPSPAAAASAAAMDVDTENKAASAANVNTEANKKFLDFLNSCGSTTAFPEDLFEKAKNFKAIGADLTLKRPSDGQTLVHIAATLNAKGLCSYLKNIHPQLLEVEDGNGYMPLMCLCRSTALTLTSGLADILVTPASIKNARDHRKSLTDARQRMMRNVDKRYRVNLQLSKTDSMDIDTTDKITSAAVAESAAQHTSSRPATASTGKPDKEEKIACAATAATSPAAMNINDGAAAIPVNKVQSQQATQELQQYIDSLQLTAIFCHPETLVRVQKFAQQGADIFAGWGNPKETLQDKARVHKYPELVAYLEYAANVNTEANKKFLDFLNSCDPTTASPEDLFEKTKYFHKMGADLTLKRPSDGQTLVHIAATLNDKNLCAHLKGIHPEFLDFCDNNDYTPLMRLLLHKRDRRGVGLVELLTSPASLMNVQKHSAKLDAVTLDTLRIACTQPPKETQKVASLARMPSEHMAAEAKSAHASSQAKKPSYDVIYDSVANGGAESDRYEIISNDLYERAIDGTFQFCWSSKAAAPTQATQASTAQPLHSRPSTSAASASATALAATQEDVAAKRAQNNNSLLHYMETFANPITPHPESLYDAIKIFAQDDVDFTLQRPSDGQTILHIAAMLHHADAIDYLVNKYPELRETRDMNNRMPLSYGLENNQTLTPGLLKPLITKASVRNAQTYKAHLSHNRRSVLFRYLSAYTTKKRPRTAALMAGASAGSFSAAMGIDADTPSPTTLSPEPDKAKRAQNPYLIANAAAMSSTTFDPETDDWLNPLGQSVGTSALGLPEEVDMEPTLPALTLVSAQQPPDSRSSTNASGDPGTEEKVRAAASSSATLPQAHASLAATAHIAPVPGASAVSVTPAPQPDLERNPDWKTVFGAVPAAGRLHFLKIFHSHNMDLSKSLLDGTTFLHLIIGDFNTESLDVLYNSLALHGDQKAKFSRMLNQKDPGGTSPWDIVQRSQNPQRTQMLAWLTTKELLQSTNGAPQ